MNFSLYQVDKPKKLKRLSSNKMSFFKNNDDDINLFHFNEIETGMFHIVYNIEDVYQVGTKRVGNQMNLPFRQFINCFFFIDNEYFLLEETIDQYREDLVKHVETKAGVAIKLKTLNNNDFVKLFSYLNGFIKRLEYVDENEVDYFLNSVSGKEFNEIAENYTLDRVTLLVEDQFVSIYRKGKISVDNSDEEYLIKFTKEIANAIHNNN
ncbi:hypothetical protein N781_00445 [Pontibacillus halophilus JSM 076056 = DSM 19796]|uniref:Uncharacterized protein n=1 Tax=Pontibacillus halophilus JSM 076056 = DSM 19796 TaxID=1385510 RepID=A0A0A5GQ28_9BACI|nr:hypothetical protein [Pontibacillus halophilus]KGX94049.1 hypothetical protein N781_00445 [Pontibacillus halophilus JSM 076056 = DSM 19796]